VFLIVQPQHKFMSAVRQLLDILRGEPDNNPFAYRYQLDPADRSIAIELNDGDHILTTHQFRELAAWVKKYG